MNSLVRCPHAEDCGACSLLDFQYQHQLRQKQERLVGALEEYRPGSAAKIRECLPSPVTRGYRNRARMAVGISRHHAVRLGYFREKTREIVDAPECRVLIPEVLDTTRSLRRLISRRTSVFPRELRHIDVRCGSAPQHQHLILVFRSQETPRIAVDEIRRACPNIDGISINLNPSAGPQVVRGRIDHVWGRREIFVDSSGLSLRVSPGSFFQVNLSLLPEIHRLMTEFLDRGESLADLYSGVGTHGLALRENFRRIVSVEGVRSAVADEKAILERYSIDHIRIVAKPVERSARQILAARPDAVVMNPSRAGAAKQVLETLVESPARKIAYLSCNPETLARDLDFLVSNRFELVSIRPIDIMPQTQQVEALAFLRRSQRRPSRAPRRRPVDRRTSRTRADQRHHSDSGSKARRRSPARPPSARR